MELLAHSWPGRAPVGQAWAHTRRRGPARTLGFIIYIYIHMYVPACQHHDRACAGCGRQLAWTWPGRGAVRAQHAVHCSRGPARTLGFIIYIYIYQQVCRLWCVHFIRTSDMARFGHCPYSAVPVLLGRRPAAALVKKNPPAPQKLQTPFPRASQSMCAPGAPRRCLGEKKTACPSKTADVSFTLLHL